MTIIEIKKLKSTTKEYLKNFHNYKFESLLHLIFELFHNHKHGQKEIIEIEKLLYETGFSNLKDISKTEINKIKELIRSMLKEWERLEEPEYLSYKLMAAVQAGNVVVIVDDKVIENFESPITIDHNSVITFINNSKLNSITFSTL